MSDDDVKWFRDRAERAEAINVKCMLAVHAHLGMETVPGKVALIVSEREAFRAQLADRQEKLDSALDVNRIQIMENQRLRELLGALLRIASSDGKTAEELVIGATLDVGSFRVDEAKTWVDENTLLRRKVAEVTESRNSAYTERNRMVVALAQLVSRCGGRAGSSVDFDAEPGWQNVVYVDLPMGQISFHFSDLDFVQNTQASVLPVYPAKWDGHTTEEKWARVKAYILGGH